MKSSFFCLFLTLAFGYVAFAAPATHLKPPQALNSKQRSLAEDTEALYAALHASSVDTAAIIDILANHILEERLWIVADYLQYYEVDLLEDLKDKLSGDFENVIVALVTPLDELQAAGLNAAVVGLGTNDDALAEILISLDNDLLKSASDIYYNKYEETLEDAIVEDTDGFLKDFLVELSHAGRDESTGTDEVDAATDAQALIDAGDDFETYNDILTHRSFDQLSAIFDYYLILSDEEIDVTIEDKFSGDIVDAFLAVVEYVRNRPGYYAKRLNQSMAGLGTNDSDLTRLVVTRSEIDIDEIKTEYKSQFSSSLADDIISETSGDYQKCLLTLIGSV